MADVTGNEILARCLKAQGVKDAFFIMGGPMLDAEMCCIKEGIRLIDTVGNDRHDHGIGHELTARHDLARADADRGAGFDRRTQHVTGGKLHQSVFGNETLSLSAFAGPRRAEQYQSHLRRPRSLDRLIKPSY